MISRQTVCAQSEQYVAVIFTNLSCSKDGQSKASFRRLTSTECFDAASDAMERVMMLSLRGDVKTTRWRCKLQRKNGTNRPFRTAQTCVRFIPRQPLSVHLTHQSTPFRGTNVSGFAPARGAATHEIRHTHRCRISQAKTRIPGRAARHPRNLYVSRPVTCSCCLGWNEASPVLLVQQ
jgi:hypothetical protein